MSISFRQCPHGITGAPVSPPALRNRAVPHKRADLVGFVVIAMTLAMVGLGQKPKRITIKTADASLDLDFGFVSRVRELSDGRIVFFDGDDHRLLVADFGSGAVKQIGRTGHGPGEYTYLVLFALNGDSTIAIDMDQSRALVLDGDKFVRTFPSGRSLYRLGSGYSYEYGADRFGSVLAISILRDNPPDSNSYVRTSLWTGRVDTVGVTRSAKGPWRDGESPFLMNDGWIAVIRSEPYRVDWLSPDGNWIRGSKIADPVEATDRERRAFLSWYSRNRPKTIDQWPERLPMLVASGFPTATADGKIVITRIPSADDSGYRYDIVDRRGRLEGYFVLSKGEELLSFGRKSIYLKTTDENGLVRIRRHPWP